MAPDFSFKQLDLVFVIRWLAAALAGFASILEIGGWLLSGLVKGDNRGVHVLQKKVNHRPNVIDEDQIAKTEQAFLLFLDLNGVFLLGLCVLEPVHAVVILVDFLFQVQVDVHDGYLQQVLAHLDLF